MLRQNQRALNKAMRDLDRERAKMEQQEKKVIADIKKMAKQGQMVGNLVFWLQFIQFWDSPSIYSSCEPYLLCDG